ncbi:DUF3558 domain-containing protein [Streptomyces gardneri]|uniref:DUF3558 domain-containing protein n=1 Tax=Nocardia TaxID=1817 RepID=UPI00135B888D|nr:MULTISPECIES: DUF3558 domain-containing protein [Nocardia]MBF6169119.1 DUF3558 domain-containing protein [Streptomyces gardneri]MBF6207319.1 DUF3558 domain-containing protein [Streptomyces gardneri]UAK33366.1 DUF3558 domain-containing protein [Nocardia asteroides]
MNVRRGLYRRGAAVVVAAALALSVGGCSRVVSGSAHPVGGSQSINTKLDKLLRECEILSKEQIGKAIGESIQVSESFFGAVCMWDLVGAPGGNGMATLNWYENGTLSNEKQTNNKLGYTTTNITVQSALALQIRRPNDPDSCGVTASAPDNGVIGWWINYRPGSAHPDPCDAAGKLMEMTLNLAR